jgi:hypothetical protein
MHPEPFRRALRRAVLASVAVVFAATAAGRPFVAWATAERAIGQAAGPAADCAHQHHAPSNAGLPCGLCCLMCGPACGGCAPPPPVPVALGLLVSPSFVLAPAPSRDVLPPAAAGIRQPPPIGPPAARVA